mmetsp:Transcript_7862/g.19511  ORF Transcript_7862/g.19511 Transcript_7862/m.19511 type:complete len:86 (+) Transcript_7862:346-603(+)
MSKNTTDDSFGTITANQGRLLVEIVISNQRILDLMEILQLIFFSCWPENYVEICVRVNTWYASRKRRLQLIRRKQHTWYPLIPKL